MPQSTIRYYDNPLPQRQITITPPPAERPKILQGIQSETEYAQPVLSARKPIKVNTPQPETENVLLRDEEPVPLGGEEPPSAIDVIEEQGNVPAQEQPVEEPPVEPQPSILSELSPQPSILSEPAPPPSILSEPFPLPPTPRAMPIEEWGGEENRPISFQIEERKGALRTLPPLSSARLLSEEEEGTGGIGIVPSGVSVMELFKRGRPPEMRPPSEPPTERLESPKQAEEQDQIQKIRKPEPEWYKLVKRDFNDFNLQQAKIDKEEKHLTASEVKNDLKYRTKAYKETGQLVGFDIPIPQELAQAPLKRGFSEIGKKALGGGYSFV